MPASHLRASIEARNAKKKAMENAVWLPKSTRKVHQASPATQLGSSGAGSNHRKQRKITNTDVAARSDKSLPLKTKRQHTFVDDEHNEESSAGDEDLEPKTPRGLYRPHKLRRTYAMLDVNASTLFNSDELDSDTQVDGKNGQDSDADEESEGEEQETTAMRLADEGDKKMKPHNVQSRSKSKSQSGQSARDRKQAAECGGSEEPYSSDIGGTTVTSATPAPKSAACLIQYETGKVKLLDQNQETRRVVRDAIMDAKGHLIFINAYPELVDKNQVALQSLLTVAKKSGAHAIKQRLQEDTQYATQLGNLVEPRIPLLRRDLKEVACANIDGYFRLGQSTVKAKKLMEQHAYSYSLKFDSNDNPSPRGNKPYQGELVIFLLHTGIFNGPKSIGVKFAERFIEIAGNKAKRPEMPVPLLALVATAIYAALFWKTLGSPGKFNFTGNQFSETYMFHVKFLEDLKKDVPKKFHCMMADIYESVQ
ncbi:uncharacterized protein BJ212DRAFT_1297444 [Suillus subaureus]|uniref:DUF6532 domain-containing protein n=1 Tax=Suillus subaureus TaxID=48587 RepID=A0A9P7EHM8_9AGAM|nr:uncharacterized protein BJ212DRAFT_1297444 [Suillus subaureus]KAG1820973.1 hypothetical protein BJ212DRAFT_1297444 [Suillus subaureus]